MGGSNRDEEETEAIEFLNSRMGDDDESVVEGMRRRYERSKDPWFLFFAIHAIEDDEGVPDWISKALFDAARSVALGASIKILAENNTFKSDMSTIPWGKIPWSMDAALGIKSTRGRSHPHVVANKEFNRDAVFNIVNMLRAAYDISLEKACESAYYMFDADACAVACATIEAKKTRFETEEAYRSALADAFDRSNKTFGEKFGASLDTLIDAYHRNAKIYRAAAIARIASAVADFDPNSYDEILRCHWAGELMGMRDSDYVWKVAEADPRNSPSEFPMRHEFRKLADKLGL
jgi:hypothetical protein